MRPPTYLGEVASAAGATISVSLAPETLSGLIYIEGQNHRVGQVGSFVRIPQGLTNLFGLVLQAGAAAIPNSQAAAQSGGNRWLSVEIIGESRVGEPFSRGVFRYPTIGDDVHLVTEADLAAIYGTANSDDLVDIGVLSSARTIPARLNVNKLVTRHCAIVGATGSGKSTTVAGLIHSLVDATRFPSARVLMLDVHGEYAAAFQGDAKVFRVSPVSGPNFRQLFIPFWALTFDELIPLTFGTLDEYPRGRVNEWITQEKRRVATTFCPGIQSNLISVDTPIPFSLKKVWHELRWEIDATYPAKTVQSKSNACLENPGDADKLEPATFKQFDGTTIIQSKSTLTIRRQLEALASRLRDPRLQFLYSPGPWSPDLAGIPANDLDTLLAQWLGDGGSQEPRVSILDLSGIPFGILEELIGALLRLLFDSLFWARNLSEGGRARPLFVVMEEAHAYLNRSGSAATQAAKRIVKEGRKYGIGAAIVSQRPSEIEPTILSQCGTMIGLRMGNTQDRGQVAAATSENLRGLLDLLPTLRTGEAIVVGEAVHLPTRTLIRPPPHNRRPNSQDPLVVEHAYAPGESGPGGWDKPREKADYKDAVTTWRMQDPKSPRTK